MRLPRTSARAVPLLLPLGCLWGVLWGLLVLGPLGARAAEEQVARRARVDRSAVREATSPSSPGVGSASAPSYAHDLRARLLLQAGDFPGAVNALRLALATDVDNPYLLMRLGEGYLLLGELERAERESRRAVELYPRYYEGRLMLARVLKEARKAGPAQAQLRRAIRLKPREPEAYLRLAQLYLEERANARAEQVVGQLARALPGEVSGYRRLGLALAEREDAARAVKMLQRALERDPGDVEVWLTLARLHEKAGRLARAEECLARALERDPDNAAMLEGAGRLALRLGSSMRARAYFDRLLAVAREPELTVQVGLLFLAARDNASAVEVLDTARRGGVGGARVSFYAGLVHERLRHYEQAAAAYAEVPVDSTLSADAHSRRALCLSQAGRHAEALALLGTALSERPEDAGLRVQQARAVERGGEPERAVALLREALGHKREPELIDAFAATLKRLGRLDEAVQGLRALVREAPGEAAPRYVLATVLLDSGDVPGALAQMRDVVRLEPEHAAALNFIGYLLAQHGRDFDEAERLVRRALVLRPRSGAFLDSLGWIHYQRGDYAGAVRELGRAVELEPEEPVILEHLGDACRRLARPREAARAWRRALELLEQTPEAAEPADQRALIERKLKLLSTGAAGR